MVRNFLVCQVISQDHMIKGSNDFMGRSLSCQVTTLSRWQSQALWQQRQPPKNEHSGKCGNITANVGPRFRWISVAVYARLLPPLFFSIKHMVCSLTRNFKLTEHLSHNFSQMCPRILVKRTQNNNLSNIKKLPLIRPKPLTEKRKKKTRSR